jgi:hypothetical protein
MSSAADNSPAADASPLWPRLAVAAVVAVPLVWMFGEALATDQMFGYRDAAHYYYPLYWFVQEHWRQGIVPLWNSLENLGQPLAADPTSAAFYPGKLIFFLPLSYEWLYKAYIVGHVALCAATTYWLARQWQASRPAAALAAVCYTFGGSVFMQYANVVFLVGAAWLPVGLWGAHRLVMKRDATGVLAFALSATLMILGGDPEAAYLATLALLGLAFMRWRDDVVRAARATPHGAPSESPPAPALSATPWYATTPALIAATLLATFGLSAIQTLPMLDWGRKTERAVFETPRSVWEFPEYVARSSEPEDPPEPRDRTRYKGGEELVNEPAWQGLIGPPSTFPHPVYNFSVGPWRFVELLWPNFYGREFPENRRWGSVISHESSPWTPSLYFGILPWLLALGTMNRWQGAVKVRWLTWLAILLALGSLGIFGIAWVAREIQFQVTRQSLDPPIGDQVGGLYWFATVVLPGFVQFRYPAKLLVLAMLALALLAARGFDRMSSSRLAGSLWWATTAVAVASLVALVGAALARESWEHWVASAPENFRFGVLQTDGAWIDLVSSLAQGATVAVVLLGLFTVVRPWHESQSTAAAAPWLWALVLLTAVELSFAHAWSVVLVPQDAFQVQADEVDIFSAHREHLAGSYREVMRERTFSTMPRATTDFSDWRWHVGAPRGGLARLISWQVRMPEPKYNLFFGVRAGISFGSGRYAVVQKALTRPPYEPWPNWIASKWYNDSEPEIKLGLDRELDGVYESAVLWSPLRERSPRAIDRRYLLAFREGQRKGRLFLESGLPMESLVNPNLPVASPPFPQQSTIEVIDSMSTPGYRVTAPSAGWRVFPDRYDEDFICEVKSPISGQWHPVPVVQAARVYRAIYLPAGKFEVRFLYRPWAFYLGAAISGAAWIGLAAGLALWGRNANQAATGEMTNAERPKAE